MPGQTELLGDTVDEKNRQETVRIELTEEQKKQLREQTGQDANAIEFTVDELEERIAPVSFTGDDLS